MMQHQSTEHHSIYLGSPSCDRLVLPFVLARFKVRSPREFDENNDINEPTSLHSLPELSETPLGMKRNGTGKPNSVKSLINLSPRSQKKIDTIIDSAKARLKLKDQKKRLEFLASLKRPSTSASTSASTKITDSKRALRDLFSSGTPGHIDIKPPIKSQNQLPITVSLQSLQPSKPAYPNFNASTARKHSRTVSALNISASTADSTSRNSIEKPAFLNKSRRLSAKTRVSWCSGVPNDL